MTGNANLRILAIATGGLLVPVALIASNTDLAMAALAPALLFWAWIPIVVTLALMTAIAQDTVFGVPFQFVAIALGAFTVTSGMLLFLFAVF